MAINYNRNNFGCEQSTCPDEFGCSSKHHPDFTIRQHDTRPELRVCVEDGDGPMDIRGLVIEVNMWAMAKLKRGISPDDGFFGLSDAVGYQQIMINDVIVMDRVRLPEYMLVTGFDEDDKLVRVQRGYKGTTPCAWKKGSKMRIFRVLNGQAETEMVYDDIREIDGTKKKNVITAAYLVYKWQPEDTCLPGCFWLEFKLLKMLDLVLYLSGGHWTGPVYQNDDSSYWTGTVKKESSVQLSYDSVHDLYLIPTGHWTSDYHIFSGNYYTGTEHNDGSVYLGRNDMPFGPEVAQQPVGISVGTWTPPSRVDDQPPPQLPPPYPSPFGGGVPYEPATDQFGEPYYEPSGVPEPFLARPFDERVPLDEQVPYENPFTEPFFYPGQEDGFDGIYGDLGGGMGGDLGGGMGGDLGGGMDGNSDDSDGDGVSMMAVPEVILKKLDTTAPSLTLEINSSILVQVQLINTNGFVYDLATTSWVDPATISGNGLIDMSPSPDPLKVGWYVLTVTVDSTITDGVYRAVFYSINSDTGNLDMISGTTFGVVEGLPYTDGVLPQAVLPPSPTDIASSVMEETIAAHTNPGTVGALCNNVQELITQLQAGQFPNQPGFNPSYVPDFNPSYVFAPSFTPPDQYNPPSTFDPTTYGCWLGVDVEWTRRLPVSGEGFLIRITESFTGEI